MSSPIFDPTRSTSPPGPSELGAGLPAPTSILIVDDNLQNLELMQAYLEELDCPVRTARDGMEALQAVEREAPDLILLDVMMPRMSGFQVCSKLKAAPSTREIPVIMVTALNELGDVEKAKESGADDFVTKPVNKVELVIRVKSLLQLRLLRRKLETTMEQMRKLKGE